MFNLIKKSTSSGVGHATTKWIAFYRPMLLYSRSNFFLAPVAVAWGALIVGNPN